jgi:hypothetical protein
VRLWSGVVYWDATDEEIKDGTDREYVPVGTLVIDKVRSSWPKLAVTGYDRMWIVQRSTFTSPYTVAKSANALDSVEQMFRAALPGPKQDFNFPQSDETTPLSVWDEQADRADAGQQIANSAGYVVYVDPMGTFRAVVEPEPTEDNVIFRYVPDEDNSQMFRPEEEISGTDAYNAVVAKGESPDGVVVASRGYAVDVNPRSLTYSGDIGIFPYYYTSPLLDTKAKAQAAAETILRRELGLADTIVVPVLPNPAHESGDVIYVEDPDQEIADVLIVDDFQVPIRATDGIQELSCRAQVFL